MIKLEKKDEPCKIKADIEYSPCMGCLYGDIPNGCVSSDCKKYKTWKKLYRNGATEHYIRQRGKADSV